MKISRNLLLPLLGLALIHSTVCGQSVAPGESKFSKEKHVEYIVGNLPVFISVPHGGTLTPESIPDRKTGTMLTDRKTETLARDISQAFFKQTGKYPHIVFCHIKRTKLDCNRGIKEAAQGNKNAEIVWNDFHHFLEEARETILKTNQRAFYVDLHGQSHPAARLELGYLISNKQLQRGDTELDVFKKVSSIRALSSKSTANFAELLRGKTSFGGMMQEEGFASIPSPDHPHAGEGRYFTGGPNTRRYCRKNDGEVFGFQMECPFKGVRDTESHRKSFAKAFTKTVSEYLRIHN